MDTSADVPAETSAPDTSSPDAPADVSTTPDAGSGDATPETSPDAASSADADATVEATNEATTSDGGGDGSQAQCLAAGTLTVTNQDSTAYLINGQANPELTLCRGRTYVFAVTAGPSHPFWIKTVQGDGTGDAYNDGVTGNGTGSGNVTFVVPQSGPSTLYYNCQNHPAMSNAIHVMN
jgi:hypothetical protein